jgi:WD40 repeat protein
LGVAVSPEGTHVASASHDKSVRIWNLTTGRTEVEMNGHSQIVSGVTYCQDGRRLVSWGTDQTVIVWEVDSGQRVAVIREFVGGMNPVLAIASQGSVAFGSKGMSVNSVRSNISQPVTELASPLSDFQFLAFRSDGSRLIATNRFKIKTAWLTATGQPAPDDEPIPDFEGKTEVFSPDGKFSARIVDGKVQLRDEAKWAKFDTEMKRRLKEWSQPNPAWHLKRADECAKDKNDFAERFHLRWVVKQMPTDFGTAVRLAAVEARMASKK